MSWAWQYIAAAIAANLVMLAVDAWMEWRDRRRWGEECTAYNRCPECEPPSNLDRWDGIR